jgi:hypothetical protein
MPSIRKVVRIVRILGFIAILSALLFQNVNQTLAAETVDQVFLSGNDVWSIENKTLTVNKGIVITENATLQVISSKITLYSGANITLKDAKNGKPRLIISKSIIEGYSPTIKSRIYTYANSTVNATTTTIRKIEFLSSNLSSVVIAQSNVTASFFSSGNATISVLFSTMNKISGFYPKIEAKDDSSILLQRFTINLAIYAYGRQRATISLLDSQGQYCTIVMYDNSKLSMSGGARYSNVTFYDNSMGKLDGVGLIDKVYAYDMSDVELYKTSIFERVRAYDHALLSIDSTSVTLNSIVEKNPEEKLRSGLIATGNAQVTLMESTIDIARMFDDTKATFISTTLKDAHFYNHSSAIFIGRTEKILSDFNDYSYGLISVKSAGDVNFNLRHFAKIIIKDSSIIGRLYLDDYTKAYVANSVLRLLYVREHAEVSTTNSSVTGSVWMSDNGILETTGSNIALIEITDLSKLNASSKSVIQTLISKRLSQATIQDSEIGEITAQLSLVKAYFSGITLGTFATWNMYVNTSLQIYDGGESPSISLVNTKITKGWNFFIKDSTVEFNSSRLNTLQAFDNSIIKFYNTTTQNQVLRGTAQIEVYWYLDITAQNGTIISVTDESSQEIGSINVTNNQARFVLFQMNVTVSETTIVNNYTVTIDYNGQRQRRTITVESDITFYLTQPSWWTTNWYIIVIPVVILLAILILIFRRKRIVKTKI